MNYQNSGKKESYKLPKIKKSYTDCGVNIGRMVKRIINHAPPESINGLKEIEILDKDPGAKGFAAYSKKNAKIEIFIEDLIGWQPLLLKKSFVFPYLGISLALGHEIDHHVNRNNDMIDKEKSAERNAIKYVYPSFGIFH